MDIKRLTSIILALSIIAFMASIGCAQRAGQTQGAVTATPEGPKITIKGKIGYMKNIDGYIVQGEAPPDVLFIVNQDPKLLEELMKSGKTVMIDGHYTIGADHLFIEKIDGKAYQGKE